MLTLPTSLYIHMPWCIKKCPYCDFNSHQKTDYLPEDAYIKALLADFKLDLALSGKRELTSIFIGGGTPSLFSGESYQSLLSQLRSLVSFAKDIEITLEANPGSVEQARFEGYRKAGINRLSLGVQSFNRTSLKKIGRIHDEKEAMQAIHIARIVGFDNLNLDIMYGMPEQTPALALKDLEIALQFNPEHLSWYQFTLEPNTYFHKYPPRLPNEDYLAQIEASGLALLQENKLQRYEISAFARAHKQSQHNLNYWTFGDYFGIGAGAHGKLSTDCITRTRKHRQPDDYLDATKPYLIEQTILTPEDLVFEWMLNTTRLEQPIAYSAFTERTGLSIDQLQPLLIEAEHRQFITLSADHWQITPLGRRYTNDLQLLFLQD